MINPIYLYRTDHRISRRGMAEACYISTSALQQIEYGQFVTIPPSVHTFFEQQLKVPSYSQTQVNFLYREYIWDKRNQIRTGVTDINLRPFDEEEILSRIPLNGHPFRGYLLWLNVKPTHFARELCVPKSSFFKWLEFKQCNMPHILRVALSEAGLKWSDIDQFDSLGAKFYDKRRGRLNRN